MRMRKKPWAKPLLTQANTPLIHDPTHYKGQWKQAFKKTTLHVEIGAGKGDYWIAMAKKHPNTCWIAIEKDETASAIAIKKILDTPLDNVGWVFADAKDLPLWFELGEIDVLHLNFSDPWPKKGHHKRRLSSESFIKMYESVVAKEIVLKTDNLELFEYSNEMFNNGNWDCVSIDHDFRKTTQDDPITAYEQRFMDLNQPIYRCIWRKKHEN